MITRSAGGVVVNPKGHVLIVNQNHNSWSLPKGHIDAGETALTAAKREIYEEAGLKKLRYLKKLGAYQRSRIPLPGQKATNEIKEITFFLFQTDQIKKPVPKDPENPEARWLKPEQALKMLTHHKDKEFFYGIIKRGHIKAGVEASKVNYFWKSPAGWLQIVFAGNKIRKIVFVSKVSRADQKKKAPLSVERELSDFFKGKNKKIYFHDSLSGTALQRKVWRALTKIPFGHQISYAALAKKVGRSKAVRAVASAVARNPIALLIPCHRVIGSDGSLTGYAYGLKKKSWLLAHEKSIISKIGDASGKKS